MRRTLPLVATAAAALFILSACGDDGGGSDSSVDESTSTDAPVALDPPLNDEGTEDIGDATTVEMEADDFSFAPTFTKAGSGSEVTVTVNNEGEAAHTFTIDDHDVDVEVAPGDTAEATVTVPDGSALRYYCRFHEGQGMQGAFFSEDGQTVGGASSPSSGGGSPGGYGY
ncbi:MAG: cupredoxin domain-containing protein [Acidimicrobiia bacterium]